MYNKKAPGMASAKLVYGCYRHKARVKKREFTITFEDFLELTKQNCYICLSPPSNVRNKKDYNGAYTYNGLDRIDSSKGYTLDNVLPCCSECNYMKHIFSLDAFLAKVTRIFELHAARNLLLTSMKREANESTKPVMGTPTKGNSRRQKP